MIEPCSFAFRIKICGITSVADAEIAVAAGADAIGLNFVPTSSRYIDPATAKSIAAEVRPEAKTVGVFVNKSAAEIRAIAEQVPLDFLQLHGDESPSIQAELQPWKIIRAHRCRDIATFLDVVTAMNDWGRDVEEPAAFLLDAYDAAAYGGTGKRLDWSGLFEVFGTPKAKPFILAGGLTPENVGRAIRTAQPIAVDTASGVESERGRKNAQLVESFVREAQAAFEDI